MTGLRRKLVAVAMIVFVSSGCVFAQKGKGGGKRPPKPDTKVVYETKREKPPQSNPRNDKRGGKRGRGN